MTRLASTPAAFQEGVDWLEARSEGELAVWLSAELQEQVHRLVGQQEDQPVQAIRNHYSHLSTRTRNRIDRTLVALTDELRGDEWPEASKLNLLALIARLEVFGARPRLMRLIDDSLATVGFGAVAARALQVLAVLATNRDADFWMAMSTTLPQVGGLAFQVLTRIAPDRAADVLKGIRGNESAILAVLRILPDFLSQLPPNARGRVISDARELVTSLRHPIRESAMRELDASGMGGEPSVTRPVSESATSWQRMVDSLHIPSMAIGELCETT